MSPEDDKGPPESSSSKTGGGLPLGIVLAALLPATTPAAELGPLKAAAGAEDGGDGPDLEAWGTKGSIGTAFASGRSDSGSTKASGSKAGPLVTCCLPLAAATPIGGGGAATLVSGDGPTGGYGG